MELESFGLFCSSYYRHTNHALIVSSLVILITLLAPFLVPANTTVSGVSLAQGGMFVLAFLSPLAGIASLFPQDHINMLEGNLFAALGQGTPFSYLFVLAQCGLCIGATRYLLRKTAHSLAGLD